MKNFFVHVFKFFGLTVHTFDERHLYERRTFFAHTALFDKYKKFTMISAATYRDNLELASRVTVAGDVVECGVWRGGMIAGIAEIMGNRKYWLLDSFEGLPPAKAIDGTAALNWQADTKGPLYYDNCSAEEKYANEAMQMTGKQYQLVKGWFEETAQKLPVDSIALLRLDGDWYDSTMACFEALYHKVAPGGLTIIDDYYVWDGCARAVHDYLSKHNLTDRIHQSTNGVAYILKNTTTNNLINS